MSDDDHGSATPIESLYELIGQATDARVEQINTCFPAQVLAYDEARQTATLRPCVQRPVRDEDGAPQAEALPDLLGVPVAVPRGSGLFFSLPVSAGDFVMVHCSTWSLSEWRRQGGAGVSPGDARHHSLANAYAVPGIYPSGQPLSHVSATALVMGSDEAGGLRVTVRPDNSMTISRGATMVAQIDADGTVHLGGPGLTALLDGVVTARGIDPFTGATYGALGNASSVVLAKKG